MSTIDRMMILGVRAFSTRNGETIRFEPPLTIVAGQNGSGKTTIIECLKFATTGMLPPGSKLQGAFIHDPGLEGEREVMAQVKLQFHAPNGTRLVATRSLQLTVKKATRSQKTLEALLLMDRHGQKTTLSTRVAELDQQVPNYLGASTSLLENVIFCHQEDSLWPLAESSVLKKKFDDIFEAAKYTRAVDELKKIRKKHREDLGRLEEVQNSAKKDRTRARTVQRKCEALQAEIEGLREQSSELQHKMNAAKARADAAEKDSEQFSNIVGELSGLKRQAEGLEGRITDLEKNLKETDESDEWLENALTEFDVTLVRYEQDKQNKLSEYNELVEEYNNLKGQHTDKLTIRGQLVQSQQDHNAQIEERRQLIQQAASKHKIRGYDNLDDEDKVEDFLFKIRKIRKDKITALDKASRETDAEKQEGQTVINQLRHRKDALQYEKDTAKRIIADNDRDIGEVQKQINQIKADEGSKAVIETQIEELRNRLGVIRGSLQGSDLDSKLAQSEAELNMLEQTASKLENELIQGTQRAGELAQLTHLQQQVKESKRSFNTMTEAHGRAISSLIGEWSSETLENDFERAQLDAKNELVETERQRDMISRELDRNLDRQRNLKDDLKRKKEQARHHEDTVKQAIDAEIDDFEESLRNAQFRLESARDTAKGLGGLADWFEKVLDTAADRHACRLCERPFKSVDDPALKRFKAKVEGLIKKASTEESKAELDEAVEDHKRISNVAVSYESWKNVVNDVVPVMEREVQQLDIEHDKLLTRVESHDAQVDAKRAVVRELENISKIVSNILKTQCQVHELTSKVEDITSRQSQSGGLQTLEDIKDAIEANKDKISAARKTLKRLQDERSSNERDEHNIELQLGQRNTEMAGVDAQLKDKARLVAQMEKCRNTIQKQRGMIDKLDRDIQKLDPELAAAEERQEELKRQIHKRLQELQEEVDAIGDSANALEHITRPIQAYRDRGDEARLVSTARDIKSYEQQMEGLDTRKTQVTKAINKLDKQLQDSEHVKRHYDENLSYRRNVRALKNVRAEIEQLESKDAHIDRDRLLEDHRRQMEIYHEFSARREGVVGEMKVKDQQLGELWEEYQTDLKDAALRYKEAHIKFETTKAAVEDIGRYGTALDRAIMKYHAIKMEEVNNIINELWQRCYQGSDIDTIAIKSEAEAKATTKTHSYRVVMLKRDVELDMRGRCSAGQKVLASIIIRLALAECFSKDCAVIALDEPTTNLDKDNIEALANALHEIIQARKEQKNFQLIVITHDEAFLSRIRCGDFTDHYYRVSRDKDDNSIIEKTSILEMMDR